MSFMKLKLFVFEQLFNYLYIIKIIKTFIRKYYKYKIIKINVTYSYYLCFFWKFSYIIYFPLLVKILKERLYVKFSHKNPIINFL